MVTRCEWANNPQFHNYHDEEWGVPVRDDRKHFEFLILEGAQAGLSWSTILKRREGYRKAFKGFDPNAVAAFSDSEFLQLIDDKAIIRNKLKIRSAINNAQHFLKIQQEFGSFNAYIWQFVGNKPIINSWSYISEIPAKTEESEYLSKDLRARGFSFVGPTIMYAHMQAVGMVNDHLVTCFRYQELVDSQLDLD